MYMWRREGREGKHLAVVQSVWDQSLSVSHYSSHIQWYSSDTDITVDKKFVYSEGSRILSNITCHKVTY